MGNLPSYYFQTHGNAEQILKLHNQIKKKKKNPQSNKQKGNPQVPKTKKELGIRTTVSDLGGMEVEGHETATPCWSLGHLGGRSGHLASFQLGVGTGPSDPNQTRFTEGCSIHEPGTSKSLSTGGWGKESCHLPRVMHYFSNFP